MPVEKLKINGKIYYRWSENGKKYTGKGAKQKAAKQGRAIEHNKAKRAKGK